MGVELRSLKRVSRAGLLEAVGGESVSLEESSLGGPPASLGSWPLPLPPSSKPVIDLLAIHVRPEPVTAEPALLPTHKVSPAGRVFAPYPVTQIGTGCSEGSGALGDAILGLPLGLDIRGLR